LSTLHLGYSPQPKAGDLNIDDALKSGVQHLAKLHRSSPHWIMLEAIQQYVEREEAREASSRKYWLLPPATLGLMGGFAIMMVLDTPLG